MKAILGIAVLAAGIWLYSSGSGDSRARSFNAEGQPRPLTEGKSGRPAYRNYEEALARVRSDYRCEQANTSRSSWIQSAEYCDADGQGFFILGAGQKEYLHAGVPRRTWEAFLSAPSLGAFYNQNIKGRFKFDPGAGVR